MNVPLVSAPGRIADLAVHGSLPQGPPRPAPAAAAKVDAHHASAGREVAHAKEERGQDLEAELAAANHKLAGDGHEVRFEFDRDASQLIVRLVDLDTRKVLRQFPSDEALRAARLVKSGKPLISMQV